MKNILRIIPILLLIYSCSIEKRIERGKEKYCQYCESVDTIISKNDTIILPAEIDTTTYDFFLLSDTITIQDTVYIHSVNYRTKNVLKTNTKIITKTVDKIKHYAPIVKYKKVNSNFAIFTQWFFGIFIGLLILFGLYKYKF